MTSDLTSTDCLLWIYDASFEHVLVSRGAAVSALPRVTVGTGRYSHVAPVVEAARRRWGLDITVLRCLADPRLDSDEPGSREYSAYCKNPPLTLTRGLGWVSVGEARAQLASQLEPTGPGAGNDAGIGSGHPSTGSRVAWERGEEWSAEAMAWIDRAVGDLGLVSSGPPRQLYVWSISTVYMVPTSSGRVFFKASPDIFPVEAALTEDLSRRFPQSTPRVLAADPDRNWLLMADLGDIRFDTVTDEAIWQEAMGVIASIQMGYIDRESAMLGLGLESKPLDEIPVRLDRWANQTEGPDHAPGPSDRDAQILVRQKDLIRELCAELASFSIPPTLEHGDLDAENMFLTDGRPVLMDWSDSSISHPFFTVALLGRQGVAGGPRLDAYLRPWSALETEGRLRRAYRIARPLAALDRSLHYLDLVEHHNEPGVDRRQMERLLSSFARLAVNSLEGWA